MAPSKVKTRSKATGNPVADTAPSNAPTSAKCPLQPESANPPKLFILPKDTDPTARIVTMANPRTSLQSRYLCCPSKGFYEFTKVAAPKTTPRSWLLSPADAENGAASSKADPIGSGGSGDYVSSAGYVMKGADLFVATPYDPLFLLLPALSPAPTGPTSVPHKRLFLAADDYLDTLTEASPHLRSFLDSHSSLRTVLESRMTSVCDTVDAGDEIMYRLSLPKLLATLLTKAQKLVAGGLPPSMEESLVRKALEVPMLSLKRGESSMHELAEEEDAAGARTPGMESQTTVSSVDTFATSISEASTAATSFSSVPEVEAKAIAAPEGVPELLRLRTALSFICNLYLPSHLTGSVNELVASGGGDADFSPLTAHLTHLASLRASAMASRSLSDFSRKRSMNEDEESGETRAEKKRKKEEEEKRRKASESRGVRDLKKVNTSGMKKMSDFFKKK